MALPTKPTPVIKEADFAASIAVLEAPATDGGDTSELFTPDDTSATSAAATESLDIFTPTQPVSVDDLLAQHEEKDLAERAKIREELANPDAVLAAMAGRNADADVSDLKAGIEQQEKDATGNYINVLGGLTKEQAEAMERKATEKTRTEEKFKSARRSLIIWSCVAVFLFVALFVVNGVRL